MLDIPLLYETGGEKRVDAVVVVTAPAEIQRQRVLERPGMTPDEARRLAGQADAGCGKARRADFIVDSGGGLDPAREQVRDILRKIATLPKKLIRRRRSSMREIVFDTETTGLDPVQGHRLVEIGCVELLNRFPTGKTFHCYLNPERDMPVEAFNVHGLAIEFLKEHPLFVERRRRIPGLCRRRAAGRA